MKDFSSNDFTKQSLAQAIEEMKSIQGKDFSIENINLAELQRRTGGSFTPKFIIIGRKR